MSAPQTISVRVDFHPTPVKKPRVVVGYLVITLKQRPPWITIFSLHNIVTQDTSGGKHMSLLEYEILVELSERGSTIPLGSLVPRAASRQRLVLLRTKSSLLQPTGPFNSSIDISAPNFSVR